MKNIHILPTDKPSRLCLDDKDILHFAPINGFSIADGKVNIYITSDEEIKVGDYWVYICPVNGLDYGDNNSPIVKNNLPATWFERLHDKGNYKKIILTTDQDLIKDGVQAIDDEFLEWFVSKANDSGKPIDIVEVTYGALKPFQSEDKGYLIHFPGNEVLEEPKQETLEEFAKIRFNEEKMNTYTAYNIEDAIKEGAVSSSSIQMNTFRQELIDLYMQGWLDRDWKISEDEADEKAEMYADQIMKKYKL